MMHRYVLLFCVPLQRVSSSSHCTKMKPNIPDIGAAIFVLVTLFGKCLRSRDQQMEL